MRPYQWDKPGDDVRRSYIGRACTLRGEPAKIVHVGDGRAGVAPLDSSRGVVEYSTPLGKMRLSGVVLALLLLITPAIAADRDALLDAIRQVESGGRADAVGDNGRAIGPYQIHRGYWIDATRHGGVDWPYSDAIDEAKARQVVRWYFERYAPRGASDETLARIHNGGPRGHLKDSTVSYWRRVQRALGKESR